MKEQNSGIINNWFFLLSFIMGEMLNLNQSLLVLLSLSILASLSWSSYEDYEKQKNFSKPKKQWKKGFQE